MKKERVEDLGRLDVLLSQLLNHDLFIQDPTNSLSRLIDDVKELIYECRNIARGDEE